MIYNRLRTAGAPDRHSRFSPLQHSTCTAWSERYEKFKNVVAEGGIFPMIGLRGRGKTQMAVAVMGHFEYNLKKSTRYIKAVDFFDLVNTKYDRDSDVKYNVMDFVKPDLLVIDALEQRRGTNAESIEINHVIDKRYDRKGKATILIANSKKEDLGAFLTDSVLSRIREEGGWIEFTGTDFRTGIK